MGRVSVRRGVTALGLGDESERVPRQGRSCGTQARLETDVKIWKDDLSTFTIGQFAGKRKRMFVGSTSAPVGKSAALSAQFGQLSPSVPQGLWRSAPGRIPTPDQRLEAVTRNLETPANRPRDPESDPRACGDPADAAEEGRTDAGCL
jgi:hypothetical protein